MADRRLQVFHTVARLLSFTEAAKMLHMTQPAVTFQIRQLEEHFNTRLFERTHNRISLTLAGERVLTYAERIMALYGDMDNQVREMVAEFAGTFVVAATPMLAEYVLPDILDEFQGRYPQAQVRVCIADPWVVNQMVQSDNADMGLVESGVSHPSLIMETYNQDELVVVCAPEHALARKRTLSATQLRDTDVLFREEDCVDHEVISIYLEHHGIPLRDLKLCNAFNSLEEIKKAVRAGRGVSIVSRVVVAKELNLGTLAAISLAPVLQRPCVFITQREKFLPRLVGEFIEFVRLRQVGGPSGGRGGRAHVEALPT